MTDPSRAHSFDEVATTYATVRPSYPGAVFDEIARVVAPPARIVEIGPGPGLATLPLAERGYSILGVELGANLARVARDRLAEYPSVEIVRADFHDWLPSPPGSFDLVLAASAFHWIDPVIGYAKASIALRAGGWLALVANHPRPGRIGSRARAFWEATDQLYRRDAPALVARRGIPPQRLPDRRPEMRRSGLFRAPERHTWRWRRSFDRDQYIGLLDTYSDHRTLPRRQRTRLYAAISELIDRDFGGQAPREYRTELYLAQRMD